MERVEGVKGVEGVEGVEGVGGCRGWSTAGPIWQTPAGDFLTPTSSSSPETQYSYLYTYIPV